MESVGASMTKKTKLLMVPVCAAFLVLSASSLLQDIVLQVVEGNAASENKVWLLDVDSEDSFYTWFSASLIFLNAAMLYLIGVTVRTGRWSWLFLAGIFAVLSADEAMSFHERASGILSGMIGAGGVFYFAWVIPALVLCGLGALAYIPFLKRLGRPYAGLFILSAALFIAGAVGIEMVAGVIVQDGGTSSLAYRLATNVEETLEGVGMVVFLYTLLRYFFEVASPGAASA